MPTPTLLLIAAVATWSTTSATFAKPMQEPAPRRIAAATSELPEPFTAVGAVAELPDGRVLVSDHKDRSVQLADFASRAVATAARTGSGPLEFQLPGGFYPMRSGEIWMIDNPQRRYLRFSPQGKPLGTRPYAEVSGGFSFSSENRDPHVLDGAGAEYLLDRGGRAAAAADSAPLVRRTAKGSDTVARVGLPEMTVSTAIGARIMSMVTFSPADGFAVARSGAIALVRSRPYRIDWVSPTGTLTRGPEVTFTPLPVTDADRAKSAESRKNAKMPGGIQIMTSDGKGGQRAMSPADLVPEAKFAETKPAFDPQQIRMAPDGRVWVRRHTPLGANELYDVFDSTGKRVDRLELPARTRLIGLGMTSMYVVRLDDEDLMYLGRVTY